MFGAERMLGLQSLTALGALKLMLRCFRSPAIIRGALEFGCMLVQC